MVIEYILKRQLPFIDINNHPEMQMMFKHYYDEWKLPILVFCIGCSHKNIHRIDTIILSIIGMTPGLLIMAHLVNTRVIIIRITD